MLFLTAYKSEPQLFQMLCILPISNMEYNIAFRQLAIKPEDSNSWFIQIVKVTEMYNLPLPRDNHIQSIQ
jgi:hypothetical protein